MLTLTSGDTGVAEQAQATATGVAIGSDGLPLNGASVVFASTQGLGTYEATVGADGSWDMGSLPEGRYTVTVRSEGIALITRTVTLVEDDSVRLRLSCEQGTGALRVNVFNDKNKNGEQAKAEKVVDGVSLTLYRAVGSDLQLVETAVTNGDAVSFGSLPAGTYRVRILLPEGYGYSKRSGRTYRLTSSMIAQSLEREALSDELTVTEGTTLECGVGAMALAGLSGQVWLDADGDGEHQGWESGLSGAVVEVTGNKNGSAYRTETDGTGRYAFTQLKPGSYTLKVTLPDGYIFTTGDSLFVGEGESTDKKVYDLNDGSRKTEQDIGAVPASYVEVSCFVDSNYNGLWDADEPALQGMKVELLRGSDTREKTTSDKAGAAFVGPVRAGSYKLRFTVPDTSYDFTMVAEGGNEVADEGSKDATLAGVDLTPGEIRRVTVGVVKTGAVTGTVYYDADYDGTYGKKEDAASGVTVRLCDEAGNIVASARTNASGVYLIEDVYPGWYQVTMEAPTGYAFTTYGQGNLVVNTGSGTGASEPFYLALSTKITGMDAGLMIPAVITGNVWCDEDDSGSYRSGEGGLTTATVRLEKQDGTYTVVAPGENCRYTFYTAPGTYRVVIRLPEGGSFVEKYDTATFTVSADGLSASTDWMTLAAEEKKTISPIGGLTTTPVDGTCFIDLDADGVRGPLEPLLAGVSISIVSDREDTMLGSQSVMTGSDGSFSLQALRPGSYTLTVTLPDGYMLSRTPNVTMPLSAGTTAVSKQVTVQIGDDWSGQQLGAVVPCTLEGVMWMDEDGNGQFTAGEEGPAGREIAVYNTATGEKEYVLTTREDGSFGREDMLPGSYRLEYTMDPFDEVVSLEGGWQQREGMLVLDGVTLKDGGSVTGLRIGLTSTTSVGGLVWIDRNGKIEPLEGITVRLMDGTGSVIASRVSGTDGRYSFDGLTAGSYSLDATVPEDQYMVRPDDWRLTDGVASCVMAAVDGSYGRSAVFQVRMGRHLLEQDVGAVGKGSLGDRVWLDLNGNGLEDSGEDGIPGIRVQLTLDGAVLAETVTDQYGYYLFEDLYPGEYVLRVEFPKEVWPTQARDDIANISSRMGESGVESLPVHVTSNGHNYGADLGFRLVTEGVYPAGYGEGATQKWKKK